MSDLERQLLAKLTDPHEVSRAWEMGCRPEVFEQPLNQAVYNFITGYWQENELKLAPTTTVIEYEFPGVNLPKDVEESTIWLVEALQRRYAVNELQDLMRDAAVTTVEDPFGTLKKLWTTAYSASETIAPRYGRVNMAESVEDRRRRYLERQSEQARGVTLGLPELDAHTGGLRPGELCAVGAFSKIGKTMFLANAVVEAKRQGRTPVFFSLEMGTAEIEDRIDALFSGVSYSRLTHSDLIPEERRTLVDAQEELVSLGDLYIEQPERGNRTVKAMVNRARQLGADYIVIDQLSFIDLGHTYHRELTAKHAEIIFDLKAEISRQSSGALPCLLAVQLNRASLTQSEGIQLSNFANTSAIEQTVDLALGLSRSREERSNRVMRLDILGARRSDIQGWLLSWELSSRSRIRVLEER